jgi:hypothetical protein
MTGQIQKISTYVLPKQEETEWIGQKTSHATVPLKGLKKGLLKEILPTPRYRWCGDSIFDYKYIRKV